LAECSRTAFWLSLREDGIKVTTAVLGMAASMAGVLLQAGDERVVGPNAHILIHEVNVDSMGGKVSALEDETKFLRRLNVRSYEILAARAKLKVAAIETRAKRRDWWLTAEEAVELGFADRIGYVGANS
jgi:ATP-dependent protease ClpP protease subunit